MQVQEDISADKLAAKIDTVIQVLVDEVDEEGTIARSKADAPEIDGLVYLDGHFDAQPGDFLRSRSSTPTTMTSTPSLSDRLAGLVGAAHVLTDPADIAPFVTDWRGRYRGAAQCVVRPGSTAEVAAVVKTCVEAGIAIVPQGGNTGLCGAATPDGAGRAVVISLSRLNRIASVDAQNNTITVEAGCTLPPCRKRRAPPTGCSRCRWPPKARADRRQSLHQRRRRPGAALRQHPRTDLGLEVVLPNGDIWNGLRGLRKDNTGYDLKQLFIGAEGTLGIITGAVLKLFPLPKTQVTCWLNVDSPNATVGLLNRAKSKFDAQLTAFEMVSETALGLVLKNIPDATRPTGQSPWYVLAEFSEANPAAVEAWLADRLEAGEVSDGVVAQSEAQAKKLWALRENISEAQKIEGISIKHDVAVPVSRIPDFLAAADAALDAAFPVSASSPSAMSATATCITTCRRPMPRTTPLSLPPSRRSIASSTIRSMR
jgi:FAD/FMN-containing dehydrogenase